MPKSSGTNNETTKEEEAVDGDKSSELMASYIELSEAKQRVHLAEMKIQNLRNSSSRKYHLTSKNRKRILVSTVVIDFRIGPTF